jgi:hypothetical protein
VIAIHERQDGGFVPFEATTHQDGILSQHVFAPGVLEMYLHGGQ